MQRVLCLLSGMNAGGAETFLMKIYRHIDRTKYQMDFCINVPEKCFYEDEILALGGKIFRIPPKTENLKEFKRQLTALIQTERYQHVLRITSNAAGFLDLKIAKRAGARVCCARSSNSSDEPGVMIKVAHRLGRLLYSRYVDVAFAPSDLAAIYTFGRRAYRRGEVSLLHNAVDLDVFHYDEEARHALRREFGIAADCKVWGHVGRFSEQKNHLFLLEAFRCAAQKDPRTVLLLVGEGPLEGAVAQKVREYGLAERVRFLGVRSDIPALLSAMDVFVFPSLYEGMPNTVIEAQATGLPCVVADTITRQADIAGLVTYLPLTVSPAVWAETAAQKAAEKRAQTKAQFAARQYDIASTAEEFIKRLF